MPNYSEAKKKNTHILQKILVIHMMLDVSKIKNKQYRNAIFDKIFKPLAKEKIVS